MTQSGLMTQHEIERIAKGLTKAQRECAGGRSKNAAWRTRKALLDAGIYESVGGFLVRTPLGLAVREYLASSEQGEAGRG